MKFLSTPSLLVKVKLLSLFVLGVGQALVEELLLYEAEHGGTVLFRWSLVDVLNLGLHNHIGNDSQLQAQRAHQNDAGVVGDHGEECTPEEHNDPAPRDPSIHQ